MSAQARAGGSLAEADTELDHIQIAGETVELSTFKIGRDFNTAERLVIQAPLAKRRLPTPWSLDNTVESRYLPA